MCSSLTGWCTLPRFRFEYDATYRVMGIVYAEDAEAAQEAVRSMDAWVEQVELVEPEWATLEMHREVVDDQVE